MEWAGWDYVVSAAVEAPPPDSYSDKRSLHVMLDDEDIDWKTNLVWTQAVLSTARKVAEKVAEGKKVLVACHHGWNRSSLIAALAMRYLGATPAQAIAQIRGTRGVEALNNGSFEKAVRKLTL